MPAVNDLDSLLAEARRFGPCPVAVPCGHDPAALEALAMAEAAGLARGILVGDPAAIRAALDAMPSPPRDVSIVDAPGEAAAAAKAVEIVRRGEARVLVKGKLQTATLLRAALDRGKGLRTGRLLSNVFVYEHPTPAGCRLVGVTDGAINVAPDLAAKRQILENAAEVFRLLGHAEPRVAVLSALETVIPGHAPSLDAAALSEAAARGEFPGCRVEGPLSLDLAILPEAARMKGHEGEATGKADVLLCPDIVSANLLAKSAMFLARFRNAQVVAGAAAPILTNSRSEGPDTRFRSIAFGVLVACRQGGGV
jgi:phosphate butyryltransferase